MGRSKARLRTDAAGQPLKRMSANEAALWRQRTADLWRTHSSLDQVAHGEAYAKVVTTKSNRARCRACGERIASETAAIVVMKSEHGGWTWTAHFLHVQDCGPRP